MNGKPQSIREIGLFGIQLSCPPLAYNHCFPKILSLHIVGEKKSKHYDRPSTSL